MNEAATATAIFPFRQPQERESTIRSRARSGPATTPPRHQVPSSPEGEHAATIATEGRSSRHRPAGKTARPATSTSDNSETRNRLPTTRHEQANDGLSTRGEPSQDLELPRTERAPESPFGTSASTPSSKTSSQTPSSPTRVNTTRGSTAATAKHRRTPEQIGEDPDRTGVARPPEAVEHPGNCGEAAELRYANNSPRVDPGIHPHSPVPDA